MIYRIYPTKDTFITNFQRNSVPQTGSNAGLSEILEVFKKTGISGSVGWASSSSLGRILTQFDMANFPTLPSGTQFILKMSNAEHRCTLPSSFDLNVQALSQPWDEGKGHDIDGFYDKGYANWDKPTSTTWWTIAGSSGSGPISSQHFDDGDENLELDVTNIVSSWITGSITNNGFLVKLSSSQENNGLDYYIKMFHGRNTHFKDKRPYLEARWNDFTADDRNDFLFDVTGTLFLYHRERGQLIDIPSVGTGNLAVRVTDTSGTIGIFTGSHTGDTGIYSVTFAIPTGSYSGSLFNDIWFNLTSTSSWYMTGTFGIADSLNMQVLSSDRYYVNVTNLKNRYETDESVRMKLFVKPHDYNPARVLTASLDSNGTVIPKAYYRIVNDRTDEIVVPFGTGALEHTRLSYDQRGNYFDFFMGSLSPGNVYRISFLFDIDGQRQYVDQDLKFRVE